MSPDGYMKSFTREVINKTPDVLKTKILTGLNEIFPSSTRAIFAGFGNRETDNIAYLRINIPEDMIFCISEKSLITNELKKDFSMTYISMLDKIELFFPEYSKKESRLGKGTSEDLEPDRSNEEVEVGRNSDKITTESTDYKERFAVNEPGEQIDNNNIELEPEK